LEESFPEELIHFSGYLSKINKDISSTQKFLQHIQESKIGGVFPNVWFGLFRASISHANKFEM